MEKVKKIKLWRLIGILVVLASIAICAITVMKIAYMPEDESSDFIVMLFGYSFILWIPGLVVALKTNSALRRYCTKCGASLNGCEYTFNETGKHVDQHGNREASIVFEAKCPNCGTIKKFSKKFNARLGVNYAYSVENYAKRLFRR